MNIRETFTKHLFDLQDQICRSLEDVDGKANFIEDAWEREGGGGGKKWVIANGKVFEKGRKYFHCTRNYPTLLKKSLA